MRRWPLEGLEGIEPPRYEAMDLKRIITSGRYIPEIDGLRFVAILAVILYHIPANWHRNSHWGRKTPFTATPLIDGLCAWLAPLYPWIDWAYQYGMEGVLLFFSISGFILALPFARHRFQGEPEVSLRKYLWRRLTRLEPPYVIAMTAYLLIGVLIGKFNFAEQLPHFLASLLYVHNIAYGEASTVNMAAWSLEVEVQFYLLAPALCWLLFRNLRWAVPLTCLGLVAAAGLQLLLPMRLQTIAMFLHYFLAGIAAAAIFVSRPGWFQQRSLWADCGFVVATAVVAWATKSVVRELVLPVCFGGMILTALKSSWISVLLRIPLVSQLGGMCYSTYLYHGRLLTLPMAILFSKLVLTDSFAGEIVLLSLLLVPWVFLASVPLFLLFEKPFMRPTWPQDLLSFLRRRSAPSSPA
ncbi:MAG: acyltransferase [Planctomycetota bacterium]